MGMLHNNQERHDCTIAVGESVSSSIRIDGIGPRGLAVLVPSTWTAANIGFEVSVDDATFIPVWNQGQPVKITDIPVNRAILHTAPAEVWPMGTFPYMRLVSLDVSDNSAEVQAGARTLTVCMAG